MVGARRAVAVAGGIVLVATGLALPATTAIPASGQLKPPAGRMFGFVQVDDHGAYDGTVIVAHVNGSTCGQSLYDANRGLYIIDLDSSNDDCSQADAEVWFSVGPCTAYNTGTVPEFSGAERVDLVAPGSC